VSDETPTEFPGFRDESDNSHKVVAAGLKAIIAVAERALVFNAIDDGGGVCRSTTSEHRPPAAA
jgi:hypothetical protein